MLTCLVLYMQLQRTRVYSVFRHACKTKMRVILNFFHPIEATISDLASVLNLFFPLMVIKQIEMVNVKTLLDFTAEVI